MRKKAYFAASISAGREYAYLYPGIVDEVKKYFDVLTEHISDESIDAKIGTHSNDKHIYCTDMNWIKESDVVIAELTRPSLGVGYEMRYAQELQKPVLALYNSVNRSRLSAMISGANYFHIKHYSSQEEMKQHVKEFAKRFTA